VARNPFECDVLTVLTPLSQPLMFGIAGLVVVLIVEMSLYVIRDNRTIEKEREQKKTS
jgi:hypothetical protein